MPGDGGSPSTTAGEGWSDVALSEALDGYERTLIARALSAARGNVAEAARRLATDRANLYRRMRRLWLEPPPTGPGLPGGASALPDWACSAPASPRARTPR